jgi:MFS family permease
VVVASIFFSTLLLSFAATLLIAGLFGAYFGKGRSRSVGFALALVAVLLIALFCSLTWNLVPRMAAASARSCSSRPSPADGGAGAATNRNRDARGRRVPRHGP